ncbi:MAG: FAD-dependent oxidoreductase [Robiginitalea sp.]|uniref:FAD-dependent oxidoreductase n=1 Tax=Robiginitalea sp. TaxID=1902411 RepID=UPI003C73E517
MKPSAAPIYIIGAGISGLVAARTLEERGYAPVLLESAATPGGRVQTDSVGGVLFDRGFQVLLTAYPQAVKHLDFNKLNLHRFLPGALIFSEGRPERIGDPLRDLSSLVPTLTAKVGTLGDKWKIFRLSGKLKQKSVEEIFSTPEQTTLEYLQAYGFSHRLITTFFKPFFGGIFLEDALQTSSRMFEFTFKMFSEGYAALPASGIGAISRQLAAGLQKTSLSYGQQVQQVKSGFVVLNGGEERPSRATLVTVPFDTETGMFQGSGVLWEGCDNLYFSVAKQTFEEGIIALVSDPDALVNNLHYPFGQQMEGNPVLSVTVVKKHSLDQRELIQKVREDLERCCGIQTKSFLKHYSIEKALPRRTDLKMELSRPESAVFENVFLAGDYLLNASLNAAMASGEAAAHALANVLERA